MIIPNTFFTEFFGSESSMLTTKDFYQQHPAVQAMSDEEAESWYAESCSEKIIGEVTGWVVFKHLDMGHQIIKGLNLHRVHCL